MPARRMFLLAPFLLIAASALHAQTFTASYTPQQILYKGAPAYQPADLNAIVGLAPGKPYTTADVDPGLQRPVAHAVGQEDHPPLGGRVEAGEQFDTSFREFAR